MSGRMGANIGANAGDAAARVAMADKDIDATLLAVGIAATSVSTAAKLAAVTLDKWGKVADDVSTVIAPFKAIAEKLGDDVSLVGLFTKWLTRQPESHAEETAERGGA